MQRRRLTPSGIEIAPLILGGNVFGWTADEATSFRLLDAFVDAGLDMIDTADVYSMWVPGHQGGESEAIIGKWLAQGGRRDKVLITTKVGVDIREKSAAGAGKPCLGADYILWEAEESLRRLRTDYIDLYLAHRDDENTPLDETLEAFDRLVTQGKVRAIGASNFTADRLAKAREISRNNGLAIYETLQPLYNLYDRADFEQELQEFCVQEDIGVTPYFSLGCGFLTGKYRTLADLEGKPRGYRVKEMLNDRGLRILQALDTAAAELEATPAQVALAWLMAQPGITAPIASATSLEQMADLVASTRLEIPAELLETLDQASA
jgi:aryl-alcohol dehydrogenase-like predicted oxidoreductase